MELGQHSEVEKNSVEKWCFSKILIYKIFCIKLKKNARLNLIVFLVYFYLHYSLKNLRLMMKPRIAESLNYTQINGRPTAYYEFCAKKKVRTLI